MPRQYPPEFRERIVALARSGRSVSGLSADYGVAGATIYRWLTQDRIDHGEKPGTTSTQEHRARRRKEAEPRSSSTNSSWSARRLRSSTSNRRSAQKALPGDRELTRQGFSERESCRVVGVNRSSYSYWRKRPPNQRELRRAWLGPLVAKIHTESFGTYGYVRVAAELRLGHGVIANHKLVYSIMREQGLKGLPKLPTGRRGRGAISRKKQGWPPQWPSRAPKLSETRSSNSARSAA